MRSRRRTPRRLVDMASPDFSVSQNLRLRETEYHNDKAKDRTDAVIQKFLNPLIETSLVQSE